MLLTTAASDDLPAQGRSSSTSPSSMSASSTSDSEDLAAQDHSAPVLYSYDAVRSPTQGGEVLESALAVAMQMFEERETDRLVQAEYEVLDGPVKSTSPARRKDNIVVDVEDGDYEFV